MRTSPSAVWQVTRRATFVRMCEVDGTIWVSGRRRRRNIQVRRPSDPPFPLAPAFSSMWEVMLGIGNYQIRPVAALAETTKRLEEAAGH